MKKFLAGLFVAALAVTLFGTASAQFAPGSPSWGDPVTVKWRTLKAADPNGGATDSNAISNGATADLDTSLGFSLNIPFSVPDSLCLVRVTVSGTQAWASGESVYVTFDGFDGDANVWTNLGLATCGTCAPGGYAGAMSISPGTSARAGSILVCATGSATARGVASGVLFPTTLYGGGLRAYSQLRLRMRSDFATAPVQQYVTVRVEAVSANLKVPNP